MPLVDESGKLTGLGQVIGGPALPAASVSPGRHVRSLTVSQNPSLTPLPALSPDRGVHPAPAFLPASGLAPYSAAVPVPLDSGLRDHDWEPGERRRAVPFRAAGVITPESMLSNTAYELMELRERANQSAPPSRDHQRQVRSRGDQDEAARRLSDAWTRVPSPEEALALLRELRSETGDRRAVEAARAIEAMLSARQRASHRGELTCRFCHKPIERQTIMGPPPEFCTRSCESKEFRQRKREREAAEAKVGPSPVTSDPEPWPPPAE